MAFSWRWSGLLFAAAVHIAYNINRPLVRGLVILPQRFSCSRSTSIGNVRSGGLLFASPHSEFYPKSISNFLRSEVKSSLFAFVTTATLISNIKAAAAAPATSMRSDEFEVTISEAFLGLGLTELEYGDQKIIRVCVQSVKENANESVLKLVRPGMILVAVDGENIEGQSRSEVIEVIKLAPRPMSLRFRNREMFFQKLNSTSTDVSTSPGSSNLVVETAISSAPGDLLRVERLERGTGMCIRSAAIGDVVEISYQVRVKKPDGITEELIDGPKNIAPQGSRPSDENLYFVMAPSSAASSSSSSSVGTALPIGWDVSMRGMCVGERRLISLPASLAFGKQGLTFKRSGTGTGTDSKESTVVLPPDTSIVIDVRLLSLNGVA